MGTENVGAPIGRPFSENYTILIYKLGGNAGEYQTGRNK